MCKYQNLKFLNDCITESQKICKIVIRKFAIFSSGIIFMVLKISTEQRIFNILEYTKKKGTRELK